jgi:glutaredoxin 3
LNTSNNHKKVIQIYTTDYCPYCVRAKELLKRRLVPFEEISVYSLDPKIWEEIKAKSKMRTVPQIFFGERLIGGYTELNELDQNEGLDQFKINIIEL